MSQIPPMGWNRTNPLDFSSSEPANPAITRFFNQVYAWMAVGLAVTALVAYWGSQHMASLHLSMGAILLLFMVQLGLVFVVGNAINRINAAVATALFLLYAGINGVIFSGIFVLYNMTDIFSAFLVTAGTFGVMSIWAMATKRDLSRIGSIAYMALIGLIIASVVNFFMHSGLLMVAINYIGVLIFVVLTAYDTQRLKAIAAQTQGDAAISARMSIVGSLMLYLDLINLFLFILRIMGSRRR
jgi:uncharacterized protein